MTSDRERESAARRDAQPSDLVEDMDVIVTDDDGTQYRSRTRSAPWALPGPVTVVLIDGIAGGYRASRVRPDDGSGALLPHFRDRKGARRG